MSNVIQLFKNDPEDVCIDDIVEKWSDLIDDQVLDVESKYGIEAAYQFYHRITGNDLSKSRIIVDIILSK